MISLRLRLIFIILGPLLIIALAIGAWAVNDAVKRAGERFDRSLLSTALAVSRDVAFSGGDALAPETNALIRDTSGGEVFYHFFAPDGAFVTGYATPPVPPARDPNTENLQLFFDSTYKGNLVRALRFVDVMQADGLSGKFTVTVWQDTRLRNRIVQDLSWRTFRVMATLVLAVALVVWFGVRIGLSPLLELERAIDKRSTDDLTPIQRQVPIEAQGIVQRLNDLFAQVSSTFVAKDVFISNAAHQLRNPIAGVVAMSEAVRSARTFSDMKSRSDELAVAARNAGDLANQLLALERAASVTDRVAFETVDLGGLVQEVAAPFKAQAAERGIEFDVRLPSEPINFHCDTTMLGEAVSNIVDNALAHGGPALSRLSIDLSKPGNSIRITVSDDGKGIDPADIERVKERFAQAHQSLGSGLGLAIAEAVAKHHAGRLDISNAAGELTVALVFDTPVDQQV